MGILPVYFNQKSSYLWLSIVAGNLLTIWLFRTILINETVFFNTYNELLTFDRTMQLFGRMKSYAWVSYISCPVFLFVKFLLVSMVLYVGIIFAGSQYRVKLGSVLKVVLASELVFLLATICKFLWFWFFAGNYTLFDLSFFYPLSLINLFGTAEIRPVWVYPLQTVNLFHLGYLFLLSSGLTNVCKLKRSESEKIVLVTYIPALIFWVTFIMFISVDFTS